MTSFVPIDVSLTPELLALVEERVGSGAFKNASEVMCAGLRLLERQAVPNEPKLQRDIRESEEQLRNLADHLPNGMVYQVAAEQDGTRRFLFVSAGVERIFGVSAEDALQDASKLYGLILDAYKPLLAEAECEVLRTRSLFNVEVQSARTDGQLRWIQISSAPRTLPDGSTVWDGVVFDITNRKRAEDALRESEARFRNMADSAPALIWMTDQKGRLIFANMHFDHVFGRPAAEMLGKGWRDVVLAEDVSRFLSEFLQALQSRSPFRTEVRVFGKDGRIRSMRCDAVPRLSDGGAFLGYTGCAVDITDVRRAEEHQLLLINELNHRVKNTLATVQSIVVQTLRRVPAAERASKDIESRLLALSRAHDVLTRENWEGASLREIVAQAIEPYRRSDAGRFKTEGPDIRLAPRTALALAMAFHELGTNAAKYGALSNESGRVEIKWSVSEDTEAPHLRLRWTEKGGPPVDKPAHRGFGSRLIERSLALDLGGEASLRFDPAGVVWTVAAPIEPN